MPGYYRFPCLHQDTIVFACEDDLWSVPAIGGVARRLTSNLGQASLPAFSPDGALLAFTGRDEGNPEVYVMPAVGGPARRLTYLGATTNVVGWHPDGQSIIFTSNVGQPFARLYYPYVIPHTGGEPQQLATGPAMSVSYGPNGGIVMARNTTDLAPWKRYRGGRTGDLWIDPDGNGEWRRLVQIKSNLAMPLWIGDRIYFVSDHEGIGNLYSCLPTGEDVRRHTNHDDYYVRHPATDGQRIVYHAGADLYLFDPPTNQANLISIEFHSPQTQRKRKFVDIGRYLHNYALRPNGQAVAIVARGKPFTMNNWEGAAIQHGSQGSVRYRLATWLHDGVRLAIVSDADGEEMIEIHSIDASAPPERLDGIDVGRPLSLLASPKQAEVALSNHRHEVIVVDLETRTARIIDRNRYERIHGMAWSPDGRWLAYSINDTQQTALIKLCRVESGETWNVTRPVLYDIAPSFDPEGKYLYFISTRDFDPVYDSLHFDLNFPRGARPYLVTLRADLPSPFIPQPPAAQKSKKSDESQPAEGKESESPQNKQRNEQKTGSDESQPDADQPMQIDLDGITERIVAFPTVIGNYARISGIKGKALYSWYPLEGALSRTRQSRFEPPARGRLMVYDFDSQEEDTLINGITDFRLSMDAKVLIYQAGNRLRVLSAGSSPKENGAPGRKSGWLDLDRIKLSVAPPDEWAQMYREAWRLQRDHFWTEDMSGVDWQAVYLRYQPLLQRIATRSEFSDLLWEMQGELGTSHAYVLGGDYRPEPRYHQGLLGADIRYDPDSDRYRIERVVRGDPWDEDASSPLARAGINVQPGDQLIAVNGRRVGRELSLQEALVNQADNDVLLTFASNDSAPRHVTVKPLDDETAARYREWVETNRERVHAATDGRIGYIHIPDMGARGYAEFHRGYLAEVAREGLIIDVRFNGGGHVSQLLLEKLARRRLGYDVSRWKEPLPYPAESVMGPLAAITNEHAGSDGDMFSHAFKLLQLGPLIGKRTWGGVVGITMDTSLIDGGMTTQPSLSFWFEDVGWSLENYGAEPTVEVDMRPQDYVSGRDPQLERAIAEIRMLLETHPPQLPAFDQRPRLHLPTLPDNLVD